MCFLILTLMIVLKDDNGKSKLYIDGFTIVKPTQEEKRLKKYKGGDWYVRRLYRLSGKGLAYFPTGGKGLAYSWFGVITIPLIFILLLKFNSETSPVTIRIAIFIGYFALLASIAEYKTYRRRKGFWHEFFATRRLYKQKKGIFKRP
jgi:hypothetical protein